MSGTCPGLCIRAAPDGQDTPYRGVHLSGPRRWLHEHNNVLILGPTGSGKSSGAMLPAHRRRPGVSLPGMEMRAELGVAVALRMPAQIFQPQQPQCQQAEAWHNAGVANGGTSIEDPPGVRPNGAYLAYLRDPDGHKLVGVAR
jgi:hypothetical protein